MFLQYPGDMTPPSERDNSTEIAFGLTKRVLANNENLVVNFNANNWIKDKDTYVLAIKLKEKILYLE